MSNKQEKKGGTPVDPKTRRSNDVNQYGVSTDSPVDYFRILAQRNNEIHELKEIIKELKEVVTARDKSIFYGRRELERLDTKLVKFREDSRKRIQELEMALHKRKLRTREYDSKLKERDYKIKELKVACDQLTINSRIQEIEKKYLKDQQKSTESLLRAAINRR